MAPGSANDLDPRGDATAAASYAAAVAQPGRALHLGSAEVVTLTAADDESCIRGGSLRKSVEVRRVIR